MGVFMEMSEREQRLRLSGILPSVDEFWGYRLGSSAVHVTLAVNEYVVLESGSLHMLGLLTLPRKPLIKLKVCVERHATSTVDHGRSQYEIALGPYQYDHLNVGEAPILGVNALMQVLRLMTELRTSVNDLLSLKKEIVRLNLIFSFPFVSCNSGSLLSR